jgi:tetratricopeptide (TPR) repeat protein
MLSDNSDQSSPPIRFGQKQRLIILALALLLALLFTRPLEKFQNNLGNLQLLRFTFTPAHPDLLLQIEQVDNGPEALPTSIPAAYRLTLYGRELLWQDNPQQAVEILQKALALDPRSSAAYYFSGFALSSIGQSDAALERFSKAIEFDSFDHRFAIDSQEIDIWWPGRPENLSHSPSPAMAYIQMSAIYYGQKQWDQMIAVSQSAIEADENNPLGYLQQGVAYYRKGVDAGGDASELYLMAKQSILTVASQMSDWQFPYFLYLGRISNAQGDLETAVSAYKSLAKTSPYVEHLQESATFLASLQQYEDSLPVYEAILSQMPLTPEVGQLWIDAAEAFYATGDIKRACDLLIEGKEVCGAEQCVIDDEKLKAQCLD